jgi:hypothetical protein
MKEHLARLKAIHILFLGESVMRDPWCRFIHNTHVDKVAGNLCDGRIGNDYHCGNAKQVTIQYGDEAEEGSTLLFIGKAKTHARDKHCIRPRHVSASLMLGLLMLSLSSLPS